MGKHDTQPRPEPEPRLPDLGEATRTIIVTSTPGDWEPHVEYAENWVSPYEAYALLWAASVKVRQDCPQLAEDADDGEEAE